MRPSVAETVWNWRRQSPAGRSTAAAPGIGRAALVQALVMGAIGALVFFALRRPIAGLCIWGLTLVFLVLGMASPRTYRHVQAFGRWLGRMAGRLLLYLLLVPTYAILFSCMALLLKIVHRDPMHRGFLPAGLSYWWPKRRKSPVELYERQFLQEERREARKLRRPLAEQHDGDGGTRP